MKKLVVYYSLTGNTKFIAKTVAKAVDADVLELKPKKDIKKKGVMRYLWGGKQVLMKSKPELLPLDKDPRDYDLIFIGTPVWSFTYAPALRTFFSGVDLKNKKIALFCCHEGGMGKTLKSMESKLHGNKIIGTIDFFKPLGKEDEKKQVEIWAKKRVKSFPSSSR